MQIERVTKRKTRKREREREREINDGCVNKSKVDISED